MIIDPDPATGTNDFSLGLYYLPENSPALPAVDGLQYVNQSLETLVSATGLIEITTFQLGSTFESLIMEPDFTGTNTRIEPPTITSSQDITIYRIEDQNLANEHNYLTMVQIDTTYSPFEDRVLMRDGVPAIIASSSDTFGTDDADWIILDDDTLENATLSGEAGDDQLNVGVEGATVFGGEGDDLVFGSLFNAFYNTGSSAVPENVTVYGDNGDDFVLLNGGSTAFGGDGNDRLNIYGGSDLTGSVHGEADEDNLAATSPNSSAFGGDGNDRIQIRDGAAGFGDDEDDLFLLNTDDEFILTATGGSGSDTFHFQTATKNTESLHKVTVSDFNSAEDSLVISRFTYGDTVQDISVTPSETGDIVTLIFAYTTATGDEATRTLEIQLTNVTEFQPDQLVIT